MANSVRCRKTRKWARIHYPTASSKGFSLLELIILIIVLSILSAIAIPLMGSLRQDAIDAAVKSQLGNLRSCGTVEAARIYLRGQPLENFNLFNCLDPGRFTNYSQLVVDNPPFHFLVPCNSGGIPAGGVQWCTIDMPLYGAISFNIGGETHTCFLYVDTNHAFYIYDTLHFAW